MQPHPAVRYLARNRPSPAGWVLLACSCALVALVAYGQAFYTADANVPQLGLSATATACGAAAVALWLVLAAAVFRAALRYPVRGARSARNAALLSALGCVLMLAQLGLRLAALYTARTQSMPAYYRALTSSALLLFLYLAVVGVLHALDFAVRYQGKANAELRLRAELAETELQRVDSEMRMLKLELNPHFVLNALNSVSALLYVDPDRARDVVVRLGELLRKTLETSQLQQVPLAEEIRQLQPFVEIQQVRFGSGLEVRWEVDDDTLRVPVPHMVLQPLVENAIKHGVGGTAGRGEIRIRAWRAGAMVHLQVSDNGRGPSDAPPTRGGVGLANVRSRLARTYGDAARFELTAGPEGGALATVTLPAGEMPASVASPGSPGLEARAGRSGGG